MNEKYKPKTPNINVLIILIAAIFRGKFKNFPLKIAAIAGIIAVPILIL